MKIRIHPRSKGAPLVITPALGVTVHTRPLRILDFDIECRPLHWIGGDYVSREVTAIAWAWVHDPDYVICRLLGQDDPVDMLLDFVLNFNEADLVTGHYIRGFDLPVLNSALIEYELPPLAIKMVQDTKVDLIRRTGLSVSQENLGATFGLAHPKVGMNQATWRSANRLTPEGLEIVRERVIGDVRQHIELRQRLLDRGYLKPPSLWSSGGMDPLPEYQP